MAYNDAITDLELRLFKFDPEAQTIYNLINGLKIYLPVELHEKQVSNIPQQPPIDKRQLDTLLKLIFDEDAPVTDLILFSINYLGVLSKAKNIEGIIRKFTPSFNRGLSSGFFKLKENDLVWVYNPTGSNHTVFYGLKEWFISENKPKDEYKPDAFELL